MVFGKKLLLLIRFGGISISHNVLPLAVSGGFGTQNCQTKIKVKWNTKI
jgi:hypothetical protein